MLSLNGKDKERMPLPNDGIVNYSYQSAGGILTIRFHTGNIFQYKGVNLAVYDVFNASKDKNVFYERSIKGKYSEQQVFEYVKKVKVGESSVFEPTELKFADNSTVTWSRNANGEIEATVSVAGGSATPTSAEYLSLVSRVSANSAAGGGSVTSAEYLSLVNRVSSNSAQMTSADDAISAAVVSVVNRVSALSVVVSNAVSAITENSAALTSALNRVSALSVVVSNAVSAIVANSAQMTSADNANSAATASAINRISALSVVVSNAVSAIVANSATMTVADNTLSSRIDLKNDIIKINYEGSTATTNPVTLNFSGAGVVVSAVGTDVEIVIAGGGGGSTEPTSAQFSALSARVAANSAQMTSADNAISAANAATSARVTANSAQMTSADNAISAAVVVVDGRVTSVMSAVSAESAARAAADTSLDGRITSVMSAVSTESAARAAADTSLDGRITSVNTAVNTISAGLGGVQLKVVADQQTVSGTGLQKISGLSASVAAAGVYQLNGWIMYAGASTISVVGFGVSTSGATFGNVGLRWLGNLSIGTGVSAISTLVMAAGWMNSTGFGAATFSANLSAGNGIGLMVELAGVAVVSTTGGSIQLKIKSGTTGVINVRAGSYLRCFKIA